MRIIAGTYRGLRLRTLKGAGLRPTSDHLRETLFNVLGGSVHGSRFLDAYAGSGAVGIEALSRGASDVVFLEHHRPAVAIIRENLNALGLRGGFQVIARPVWSALERLEREGNQFEIVFLDPPYDEVGEYHRSLRILARSRLLLPDSQVIAEHARQCKLEEHYGELHRTRLIRHGDSQLAFYRKAAGDEL
ncbi:MAG TPA: 16S rRNA (guanine(966)-N(2))-methyltransferase RsmD [Terriglobia bacterium]|nr:16S rRNA (guanine(966)-N(2))-methyltransferase RsmD [Terriglobia bacterium]